MNRAGIVDEPSSLHTGLVPPVAVLRRSDVEHNLSLMATYCEDRALSIAPHGKTTMSPQLVSVQLERGAWGVTVSTPYQAEVFATAGVQRILLAHQVVDQGSLGQLARLVSSTPELELIVIVDSEPGVERLADAMRGAAGKPVGVLVELGVEGARTGCRSLDELSQVARAVSANPALRLRGVEGYEGVIDTGSLASTLSAIDSYLERLIGAADLVVEEGLLDGELIVSAGGSAYFDVVADHLATVKGGTRLLRSGCYLIHDHVKYSRLSPLDGRSTAGERLQPALEVWAAVVSTPEPGLAILNAGRRDVGFDAGLPVGVKALDQSGEITALEPPMQTERLWDQHAAMRVPEGVSVQIGDLIGLGISHPCTTLDRWKVIPLVDDSYSVIELVETRF